MSEYESKYEERFWYIKDESLRKNMADVFQFITDLLAVSEKFPQLQKNYFYKTCILYTASLIESHIHYYILQLWHEEIKTNKREYKNFKSLHKCNDEQKGEIAYCIRSKKKVALSSGKVDFQTLNTFAKQIHLYNDGMYKKIDKMRKERNRIHLMSLEDIDRTYTKEKVDSFFEVAREIFALIERKLS